MRGITLGLTLLIASPATADDNITPELQPMAWLAGSCWEGPFPNSNKVDSHCFKWFQKGRYLRERHEVKGSVPPYGGETTYYWDPKAQSIKYIYLPNTDGYAVGTASVDGSVITFPDERVIEAKSETQVRVEIRRVDANSYVMRSEMLNKDNTWVPMQNATYVRKPLNW